MEIEPLCDLRVEAQDEGAGGQVPDEHDPRRGPGSNGATHVVVQPIQLLYTLFPVHYDASIYYPGTN